MPDTTAVHPKVAAAGIAGAVTVILAYVATLFHVDVPADVASAVTTLLAFGAGYLKSA